MRLMNTIREWRKKIQCAEIREMFLSTQCDSHSQYDLVQELQALKVDTKEGLQQYGELIVIYAYGPVRNR